MVSEAQRRAKEKYEKRIKEEGNMKTVCLSFYPSEMELYEFLRANKPMNTYIKNLIRNDMSNERHDL